jgi:hypothetical protein
MPINEGFLFRDEHGRLHESDRSGQQAAFNELGDFNPDAGTLLVRASKSGGVRHVVLTEEALRLFANVTAGRGG